ALAHLAEHVDEGCELVGQLVEDISERVIGVIRQRTIGALAEMNVVVDIDEAAVEAVGEEPGDEQRLIAHLAETVTLCDAGGLEGARESGAKRLAVIRAGITVNKTGE